MVNGTVFSSIVALIAYVGLCYVIGRLIASWVAREPEGLLLAGSPLIGSTALSLQLWLYGSLGLPWKSWTLLVPWLVAAVLSFRRFLTSVMADWHQAVTISRRITRMEGLEVVLTVVGILVALTYLLNLVTQPLIAWDAIAMWLFKAKLYYSQQAVDLSAVSADIRRHLDYPPLFSLMVATLYTLIGHVDDISGKAINFLFFLVAAASSLIAVRHLLNRKMAIIFTFLLVSLPLFSNFLFYPTYMGFADYAVGVCMMLSLAHLQQGELNNQPVSYLFAIVFAAFAALTKNEGVVFLVIILALVCLRLVMTVRKPALMFRHWHVSVLVVLALAPVALWQIYIRAHGFESELLTHRNWSELLPLLPRRALVILGSLRRLVSFYLDYPWLAVSYGLSAALLIRSRFRLGLMVYAAISLQLISYFLAYLFTPYDLGWILSTSCPHRLID